MSANWGMQKSKFDISEADKTFCKLSLLFDLPEIANNETVDKWIF